MSTKSIRAEMPKIAATFPATPTKNAIENWELLQNKYNNKSKSNANPFTSLSNYINSLNSLNNKSAETQTETPTETTYDDYGSYGAGGGGVSGPQRIDLTDILASYEKGAAAQEKAVRDSGESQRQSLLNSLKRFQEETAEARNQQRRSYNASRADLEGQAFMANRQAAQNAAARGLGGSGLQQLAQLQNLINQSAATDKLAQSNTDVLRQLAAAARNKEEDVNTSLLNLDKDIENKLATIAANNAQARANLQYQEDVRYEQARQAAEQFAASLAAQNAALTSSKAEKQESADASLGAILQNGLRAIKGAGSLPEAKEAYDAATSALYETTAGYGLPVNQTDTYRQQLLNAYGGYAGYGTGATTLANEDKIISALNKAIKDQSEN